MIDTTKPVDRTGNAFCGPLVVAAILGTSTGTVAAEVANIRRELKGAKLRNGQIKRVRARTADTVRGTYDGELFTVLERAGFKCDPVDVGARYVRHRKTRGHEIYVSADGSQFIARTIFGINVDAWHPWTYLEREALPLWRAALRLREGTYIVHLPSHWALIHNGQWCETHTKGAWVPLAAAPGRNRKVLDAWKVTTTGVSTHG